MVDANIEFIATSGSDNYRDRYDNTRCLKLECSGSLEQKFRDFKVLEIDEWTETTPRKPMDGDLIPIIYSEKYDDYAKEILSKYYPEALEEPMKIDGEELAKRMGHRIENAVITSSGRVFGAIFFEDTEIEVYDVSSGESVKRQVKKNDILIDDSAQYLCSRSITIAHECVHSYLHREAYLFRQIIDSSIGYIQCQIDARNG